MTTLLCGWTGDRAWMKTDGFDRRVSDVLQLDIPEYARFWKPDRRTRRARQGRWYVLPGYVREVWDLVEEFGVQVRWRDGPDDEELLRRTGASDVWYAFPLPGVADAQHTPRRPAAIIPADATGLGWPRIEGWPLDGGPDEIAPLVPPEWELVACHGCHEAFPVSRAELAAGVDDLDPEVMLFCRRECCDMWLDRI